MDQIVLTLKEGDVLVLSGSIPDSLSMNAYADIIASCPDGVKIFLDTRGNGLKVSLSKSVYAVKPNWKEMEEWAGEKLFSFEDLLSVAKRMIECGVKYVLFSMGKEGAAIVSKDNTFRAYAPEGQLISSVGSGDAMLAGYIFAEEKELPLSECLSYAVASGSSTAFSEGLCAAKGVQQMLKTGIRIESYY
jgi:1-phosphofructokinase